MAHMRGQVVRAIVVATALGALLGACGGTADVGVDTRPTASKDATVAATTAPSDRPTAGRAAPPGDRRPIDRRLRPLVDGAVSDLAQRVDVPPEKIRVLSAQRVTPSDDALDCPRAVGALDGRRAGARVQLDIDGVVFRYRVGVDRQEPFLCDPEAAKRAELEDRIEP